MSVRNIIWNGCPGSSPLLRMLVCFLWWFFLLLCFPSFLLSLVRAVGLLRVPESYKVQSFPISHGRFECSQHAAPHLFRPAQPSFFPKGRSPATRELWYRHLVPQSDSLFSSHLQYLDIQHQPRISFVHVCRLKRSIHLGWSWVYRVLVWRISPSWTCACSTSPTSDQGSFLCLMMPSQIVEESHMPLHIRWGKQHPTYDIPSHRTHLLNPLLTLGHDVEEFACSETNMSPLCFGIPFHTLASVLYDSHRIHHIRDHMDWMFFLYLHWCLGWPHSMSERRKLWPATRTRVGKESACKEPITTCSLVTDTRAAWSMDWLHHAPTAWGSLWPLWL